MIVHMHAASNYVFVNSIQGLVATLAVGLNWWIMLFFGWKSSSINYTVNE